MLARICLPSQRLEVNKSRHWSNIAKQPGTSHRYLVWRRLLLLTHTLPAPPVPGYGCGKGWVGLGSTVAVG